MKFLGITDEINTCDCCGRTNLKSTVVFETDDGDIVHYGSTCAGRNTGKPTKVWVSESEKAAEVRRVAIQTALYNSDEQKAWDKKADEGRKAGILPGLTFKAYCKVELDALRAKEEALKKEIV